MASLVEIGSSLITNPIFCLATNDTNRICAAGRSGQKNGFFTIYAMSEDTKPQGNSTQQKDTKPRAPQLSFRSQIHREIEGIASKTICWLKYSENNYSNLIAYGGSNGDVSLWDAPNQEKLSCRANVHSSKTVIHQLVQRPHQYHQIIAGDSFGTISIWDIREKNKSVHSFEASNNNEQSDCWALSALDEFLVLSGHRDGHLRCFDLRANNTLSSAQLKEGISSLAVHQNNIAIGTLTGDVLTFKHDNGKFISFPDLPTQNKSMMTVWGLKTLQFPTNSFVSVGSDSAVTVHQWASDKSKENVLTRVNLESTPLIAVDTFISSPVDQTLLVTAGLDLKLRLFSLSAAKS